MYQTISAGGRALFCGVCTLIMLAGCTDKPDTDNQIGSGVSVSKNSLPNFLVIVVDDVGYSDIGAFGGEIETPNIDNLFQDGLMFTNFYVAGTCSPTRSMLMTGVDHHQTGFGTMTEHIAKNQIDQPGYEGYLNNRVVTISERLKTAGYNTYMAGKWHLGITEDSSPAARGFDRSFALLNGGASHWDQVGLTPKYHPAPYREDGVFIDLDNSFTYSTDFYTQKMIGYLKDNEANDAPFFAYLAYTAPHWPLQAPPEDIKKYEGKYDAGWLAVQNARFERQKKLGLIPKSTVLPEILTDFPAWEKLSDEEKRYEARRMEIYAAMLDRVDRKVGEVINYLKTSGQFDNTVIIFMSDNGAEGYPLWDQKPFNFWMERFDNSYEKLGTKESYIFLEERWSQVANTPNRLFKGMTADGGIKIPGAIHFKGFENQSARYNGTVSVMDIAPTILDLAKVSYIPGEFREQTVLKMQGKNLVPLLKNKTTTVRSEEDGLGWELFTKKGYRMGKWKALHLHAPWVGVEEIGAPYEVGDWELYDIDVDPGETNDLSEKYPKILATMVGRWEAYAKETGVIIGSEPPER